MRHTILIATLSSVVASVLTTVVIGGSFFGAGTANSASAPIEAEGAISPGGVEGLIQGDVDCGTNVTPVDSLKVLRHDAGLSVQQDEPCPDIGTVIPTGEGVPGPQGPAGPQGEQGPQGAPGITDIEVVVEGVSDSSEEKSHERPCPNGKTAIGGGAATGEILNASFPNDELTGWWGVAEEIVPSADDWILFVYAICANVAE